MEHSGDSVVGRSVQCVFENTKARDTSLKARDHNVSCLKKILPLIIVCTTIIFIISKVCQWTIIC